jgi:hypothetical protein
MPGRRTKVPPDVLILGGLVSSVLILILSMAAWMFRAEDYRHSPNLKACAIALIMYASDGDEYFPTLSSEPGRLMFEADPVYPAYIPDPTLLLSYADPAKEQTYAANLDPAFCFENSSYFYLGYKVWNDQTVLAFADAYKQRLQEGLPFDSSLPVNLPIREVHRLDNAVRRRSLVPLDENENPEWEHTLYSPSETPLLIEKPRPYPGLLGLYPLGHMFLSKPELGGAVLYQDGHVEFIPYPGKWPMTEKTITALMNLAAPD